MIHVLTSSVCWIRQQLDKWSVGEPAWLLSSNGEDTSLRTIRLKDWASGKWVVRRRCEFFLSDPTPKVNKWDKPSKFLFPLRFLFYPFKTSHTLTQSQLPQHSSSMLMMANANEAKFDANFGEKGFERINQLKQQRLKTSADVFQLCTSSLSTRLTNLLN